MIEKVSIVIPVYNNPQGLARTLASIERLADDNFEVIVVDDASTLSYDGICDPKNVRLIRLGENSGPGFARNEGVRSAGG